jgi:signal transduction histidine kinase
MMDTGIHVVADPNHVRLILRNLISNAIKFSSPNSEVSITSNATESFVHISICDTGTGLSAEEVPKLFNSSAHFSKAGTANEKGMGVGLLLTKEFIDKNGGTISVESQVGKGSVFSFTLKKAM